MVLWQHCDPHSDWLVAGFKTTLSYHWPTFTDLAGNLPGGRFEEEGVG